MTRILIVSVLVFVLVLGGLLIGPSFVDWNRYKLQIVEKVAAATGYQVEISGDLSLAVLPAPQVRIDGVSVAAPRPGTDQTLLSMKRAEVRVALLPLLEKRFVVERIRFIEPDVRLEILKDGRGSWMTDKLSGAAQIGAAADDVSGGDVSSGAGKVAQGALQSVALDRLDIRDGRFSFMDQRNGQGQVVEDVDLILRAESLMGPYAASGSARYRGGDASFEVQSGAVNRADGSVPIRIVYSGAGGDVTLSFDGVAAFGGEVGAGSFEAQGQAVVKAHSTADLIALAGGQAGASGGKALAVEGLLTAGAERFTWSDMTVRYGDVSGSGKIAVSNLKARDPLKVSAQMDLDGVIDPMDFAVSAGGGAGKGGSASGEKKDAAGPENKSGGFLPESVTLPFPVEGALSLNAGGIKVAGQVVRGVFLEVSKDGRTVSFKAKALEIPGKGAGEGQMKLQFASVSASQKTGAVTYADPSTDFAVTGHVDQLPELLRLLAPDVPVADLWKTARFDLKGGVEADAVRLDSGSTVKLDNGVFGVFGQYRPGVSNGRDFAAVDIAADMIDVDAVLARMDGKKPKAQKNSSSAGSSGGGTDMKKAVQPLQDFRLPLDVVFDLSAQKARFQSKDWSGVRIKGESRGTALKLDVISVQDVAGAALRLSGGVSDLSSLSGVDLDFYGKAADVPAAVQAFGVDVSKMPKGLGAGEASVNAKGDMQSLRFTADVGAMRGSLKASGVLSDALGKVGFGDLDVAVKHPNFAQAMRIVSPGFKGGAALEKPLTFSARAVRKGDVYTLSGMQAQVGPAAVNGDLTVDTGGARPAVRGTVQAGSLPLDAFTGGGGTSSSGGSGGSSSKPSSGSGASGGRWSSKPFDTGWMHSVDLDLNMTAKAVTYKGWNFVEPAAKVMLADGVLQVQGMKAGLFGGQASLDSSVRGVSGSDDALSVQVQSAMENVAVEPLVKALSGSSRLQGRGTVSLDMDVSGSGGSPAALVSALGGKASLDGKDIVLTGFDLARLARSLSEEEKIGNSVENLLGASLSGGQTQFDTVRGAYDITNGIVRISSMSMDGPAAVIATTGQADLPRWTIDIVNEITLKQADDVPPFKVSIKGPLDNPANTFGRGILEDYLQRKIQRKIGKELQGVVGGELGGTLEKLGILPQQKVPAQEQPAQQEELQPQQEEPQRLEDMTPEDAIRGVLDGLLR